MYSCYQDRNVKLLSLSEDILIQKPDSALNLLESIDYPGDLSKENYAKFCQLVVLVHLNNSISIKEDTLIHHAVDYYKTIPSKKKDYVISLLLQGNVYEESESLDNAKVCFLESFEISKMENLSDLYGLSAFELGGLYKYSGNYKEGINWFGIAAAIYKSNDRIMYIRSQRQMADCYVLANLTDSALTIYDSLLNQISPEELSLKADIYKNKAVTYNIIKEYEKSIENINQSIHILNEKKYYPLQYIILASIYNNSGKADSALFYNKLAWEYAKEQENTEFMYVTHEAALGNHYPKMFENYLLSATYSDSIYQKQRYTPVIIQKLYKFNKIEEKNKTLSLERRRYMTLFILLVFCLISFYIYHKINNEKKKIEHWREIENKKHIINNMRDSLYKRLALYQKMIRLSISPTKTKNKEFLREYNKLLFDNNDDFVIRWNDAEELCNALFDNYILKIKERFPDFNETEEKIILLLKLGFSTTEISTILEKSMHTIYRYSSNMRKSLHIPENRSIIEFLDDIITS